MKPLKEIAVAIFVGTSCMAAIPSVNAQTYRVNPSLLNNGSYDVRGSNGYRGSYNTNQLGGGTYRDNRGGGYRYTPNTMGGGTYRFD